MNPLTANRLHITRRALLGRTATGIGAAALSQLFTTDLFAAPAATQPSFLTFPPKAKHVIYLFQNGAPSHVDLFDFKPKLKEWHGKEIPPELLGNKRLSTMTGTQKSRPCLGNITTFSKYGQSGAQIASFLPHTASIADELCIINSMHTGSVNHAPAITYFLTGSEQPGRASMGSWLTYGLGSESQNLPGFVVMTSRDKEASCGQIFYDFYWGSGFLPSKFQGVKFRGTGDPVLYLSNPDGVSPEIKRQILDNVAALNEQKLQDFADPEIAARIAQYEMAYKMQTSVPELTDLSKEPQSVLEMYGPDVKRQGSFAYNCLMARRLVERGVRFVQLMHAGWDQHKNLNTQLKIQCTDTDAPSAALVKDLKQRGLLDDTLVIWGGEFGRTPFLQGDINDTKNWGRDHHPYAFSLWMTGGGVKRGQTYGKSDEFGVNATENPVSIHDFQATILKLLGIDHEKLTFKFQGRRFRLTDVEGTVLPALIA
ncbi:MAG TPA: DUF1501 domain-containing protein [Tepidisphaeraceae bacterium]|jgi:hypothetical protein|nr:DUF1501 domain-containing protein [Tepidisphaeraceae bacterium]